MNPFALTRKCHLEAVAPSCVLVGTEEASFHGYECKLDSYLFSPLTS